MTATLNKLLESQTLTRNESHELMHAIAAGRFNEAQIAAVLTSFIMRSINIDELQGFRAALLELALCPKLDDTDTIDLCGTGGDGKNTFNISTLASFVVAATGIRVAKHGNYGVSSISGSSNVMEKLGYKCSNDENKLKRELEAAGITFMHAPLFHPALKTVGGVRRQLGIKSFFNILGPLVNPAKPKYQCSGVFNLETGRIYSYLLQSEQKEFRVIHSLDGYDEISLTSNIKVFSPRGEYLLTPDDFGFEKLNPDALHGGSTIDDAATIFMNVLQNQGTPQQMNVVAANAGMAIHCYRNIPLKQAVQTATEALISLRAYDVFNNLIKMQ